MAVALSPVVGTTDASRLSHSPLSLDFLPPSSPPLFSCTFPTSLLLPLLLLIFSHFHLLLITHHAPSSPLHRLVDYTTEASGASIPDPDTSISSYDQNITASNDQLHDQAYRSHTLNPTGARASEELGVETREYHIERERPTTFRARLPEARRYSTIVLRPQPDEAHRRNR